MSAVFKNSKKKISQSELRKYMNEHKKQKIDKKIDSPLAKYTDSGQLMCVICKSIVRSESVWTVHVNAKQHKEKVISTRKLQEELQKKATSSSKRSHSPQPEEVTKKPKSILKNALTKQVPDDFFDNDKPQNIKQSEENKVAVKPIETEENKNTTNEELLPEGFFDDPKLDAKARNLEYKNPFEEEWEKFQKEIKAVDNISAEIIAEDQEAATTERQIDEIEEQMRNWSRVLTMERKKEEVKIAPSEAKTEEDKESSEEDTDFDEFLDWRAKKS